MKRISATHAKNHFGELLEDVAALGRVDIVRHGRVVAVVLAPRAVTAASDSARQTGAESWTRTHMIPPVLAQAARIVSAPVDFDDEWA
jgi:prevent-host-death family protein